MGVNGFGHQKFVKPVIYCRASEGSQALQSLRSQQDAIERRLIELNYSCEIVRSYREWVTGMSIAGTGSELASMLDNFHSGAVDADVVLVETMDRLDRSDQVFRICMDLEKLGVRVLAANVDFSELSLLSTVIASLMASGRNERRMHSLRIRRARRRRD